MAVKRILKINDSWQELFNFQNSFYCQWLELLTTAPFPKRQILDSFKFRRFAEDNFNFAGNGRKFFKQVENTVGKEEIARYEQFLFFPHCFQKTCIADT